MPELGAELAVGEGVGPMVGLGTAPEQPATHSRAAAIAAVGLLMPDKRSARGFGSARLHTPPDMTASTDFDFRPIEALTFDCYGTLVDWEAGILTGLRRVMGQGRPASDDALLEAYAQAEAQLALGEVHRARGENEAAKEAYKQAISDAVIARMLDKLPVEWRGMAEAEHLEQTLRTRRDGLLDVAIRYYRDLASDVDIHGTAIADRAEVVRHDDGRVTVTLTPGSGYSVGGSGASIAISDTPPSPPSGNIATWAFDSASFPNPLPSDTGAASPRPVSAAGRVSPRW